MSPALTADRAFNANLPLAMDISLTVYHSATLEKSGRKNPTSTALHLQILAVRQWRKIS